MSDNAFLAPTDLIQANSILAMERFQPVILAGGTDLMVRFNRRRPGHRMTIIYLGRLGLDYVRVNGAYVTVGACATLADIAGAQEIRKYLPLLGRTCSEMACPAVRNAATLGGNVANGARNADGITALVALGARVVVASTAGEEKIPIEEFVTRRKTDTLKGGGLIKEFEIPALQNTDRWGWLRLKPRQGESRTIVSVAVRMKIASGICQDVRLVLGGMSRHPFVSPLAAEMLTGKALTSELIDETAQGAVSETDPLGDAKGSAWYRKKVAAVMVRRILSQLA